MADGDEDRLHSRPSANYRADRLAAVAERTVRPEPFARWDELPDEGRFCTAERRSIHEQSKMAGQAEAAWVGATVGIRDQQVRQRGQTTERREDRRRLAEGE